MIGRVPFLVAGCTAAWLVATSACAPYMAPTTVPAAAIESPDLELFRAALKTYIDATQPFRKDAANKGDATPNQVASADGAEDAVRLRQRTLAESIQTKVRPAAQQGALFPPPVADLIRQQVAAAFRSPKGQLIRDELRGEADGLKDASPRIAVNQIVTVSRVPPRLLESLPQLPEQVEFDFSGRTLILRDVDADLIVDFILLAFPDATLPGNDAPSLSRSIVTDTPGQFLPLPDVPGSTIFAVIGDSGSGDQVQRDVAKAMVDYFDTARRFRFVLMLGDNLYGDDYKNEFSVPYQGLLERGVTFYATLGNHDRDLEVHYKPFHMNDRAYFAFVEGNVRFVVLDSNHPSDKAQLAWFDTAFGNTGSKWRISFFHHPLYSSGDHAKEGRDVIRPALESALVRNRVDIVFGGHDHLYERVAPQQGIRYFVSGGGGRHSYGFKRSPFDEAISSEHHFMVVAITGDRMFFEAITAQGRMLDCGILWRTADAATKPLDSDARAWQDACRVATAERAF